MKDPRGEARRWLGQAEYDLESARHSADGGLFYASACFQSQQAAEKALKGYLYAHGERIVLGHSVTELCARSAAYDEVFSNPRQRLGVLDRFYIPTRYPNGLPGGIPAEVYLFGDAQQAISLAGEAIELVARQLRSMEE
jgi:HEPN domain-containing protein